MKIRFETDDKELKTQKSMKVKKMVSERVEEGRRRKKEEKGERSRREGKGEGVRMREERDYLESSAMMPSKSASLVSRSLRWRLSAADSSMHCNSPSVALSSIEKYSSIPLIM